MSYLQTVAEIRSAANAVNGDRFDHGRRVDFSQGFENKFPFIFLYPFTIDDPAPGANSLFDTSTLTLGFWEQDRPDTSAAEREEIIGRMDVLCTAFMVQLGTNKQIGITGVRREPQYQMHQATVSGFAVRFNLLTPSPCVDP